MPTLTDVMAAHCQALELLGERDRLFAERDRLLSEGDRLRAMMKSVTDPTGIGEICERATEATRLAAIVRATRPLSFQTPDFDAVESIAEQARRITEPLVGWNSPAMQMARFGGLTPETHDALFGDHSAIGSAVRETMAHFNRATSIYSSIGDSIHHALEPLGRIGAEIDRITGTFVPPLLRELRGVLDHIDTLKSAKATFADLSGNGSVLNHIDTTSMWDLANAVASDAESMADDSSEDDDSDLREDLETLGRRVEVLAQSVAIGVANQTEQLQALNETFAVFVATYTADSKRRGRSEMFRDILAALQALFTIIGIVVPLVTHEQPQAASTTVQAEVPEATHQEALPSLGPPTVRSPLSEP